MAEFSGTRGYRNRYTLDDRRRVIVGDLVLGSPAAIGLRSYNLPSEERQRCYLGLVIGSTPLLSFKLPATIVLYDVGVYEIFNCEHFYLTNTTTPFHSTRFSGYKFTNTLTLTQQYGAGVFKDALDTGVRDAVVRYVMEKDEFYSSFLPITYYRP